MGISLAFGALFGVLAGKAGQHFLALAFAACLAALLLCVQQARPFLLSAIVGCTLGVAAGIARTPPTSPPYVGAAHVATRATVASDPKFSQSGLFATVHWVDEAGVSRTSMAFLPPAPPIGRGDIVELAGQPSGRMADRLSVDALRVVRPAGTLDAARRRIREALTDATARHVPGSPGALTLGLLIGDDSGVAPGERDALQAAGLTHITAVSGWNVSLVISLAGALFLALGLRGIAGSTALVLAISAYVWIVGADPPVVRAALMAGVALVGVRLGRPRHTLTLLSLSAATMACVSPNILHSLSFQLSVLATLGVALAAGWSALWHGWRGWLLTPSVTTCVVGLLTGPLLALRFGQVSLAMLPANIVAAPLVVVATFGGLAVALTGWFAPLATLAGIVTWGACSTLLSVADLLARLPASHWRFQPPPGAVIAACYTALAFVIVSVTPEGRALGRRIARWADADPLAASIAGVTSAGMLVAALLIL